MGRGKSWLGTTINMDIAILRSPNMPWFLPQKTGKNFSLDARDWLSVSFFSLPLPPIKSILEAWLPEWWHLKAFGEWPRLDGEMGWRGWSLLGGFRTNPEAFAPFPHHILGPSKGEVLWAHHEIGSLLKQEKRPQDETASQAPWSWTSEPPEL